MSMAMAQQIRVLEREVESLKLQVAQLQECVAEYVAHKPQEAAPRGPGRPRKDTLHLNGHG